MVLQKLLVPQLKSICEVAHLPRSGNKVDLVERISLRLTSLYTYLNREEFNRLADLINGFPQKSSYYNPRYSIKRMEDPALLEAFKLASKTKEFIIDQEDLIAPYRIIKAVSDPVYFPVIPDGLTDFDLNFTVTGLIDGGSKRRIIGVLLKVYDHASLPDKPEKGTARYRLSRGRKAKIIHGSANLAPPPASYYPSEPKYQDLTSRIQSLRSPDVTIHFQEIKKTVPYYFQVFETEFDPKLDVQRSERSAERVQTDYLTSPSNAGVLATTVRLSLRCPLSMIRMTVPIRWPTCRHLQCLERASWDAYKKSNNNVNSYFVGGLLKCPICEKTVNDKDCFVDGFTKMILAQAGSDVDEVNVEVGERDLKWSVLAFSKTGSSLASSLDDVAAPADSDAITVIDLTADDTVYTTPWVDPPLKPAVGSPRQLPLKKARPTTSTIELNSLPQLHEPVVLDDEDVCILDISMGNNRNRGPRTGGSLLDAIEID